MKSERVAFVLWAAWSMAMALAAYAFTDAIMGLWASNVQRLQDAIR